MTERMLTHARAATRVVMLDIKVVGRLNSGTLLQTQRFLTPIDKGFAKALGKIHLQNFVCFYGVTSPFLTAYSRRLELEISRDVEQNSFLGAYITIQYVGLLSKN